MKIRKATRGDAEICAAIAAAAYADYVLLMGQRPAPMLADYAAHIAGDIVFVVEDTVAETKNDGAKCDAFGRDAFGRDAFGVVGFAIIVKKGDDYWLENVAVSPLAAGKGLGRHIMGFVEGYLRPLCDRYQLYTNIKMERNIGWYHALGFTETFRGEVDGYHRVYFEKEL